VKENVKKFTRKKVVGWGWGDMQNDSHILKRMIRSNENLP